MNRRPWLSRTAGLALSIFIAPLALADVPAAMDRVPSETPVVVAMKNMGQFYSSVNSLAATLKLPKEAMGRLAAGGELLKTPGLNADGSAAMAILSVDQKDEEEDHAPVVLLVPVKDYSAFAKALGGKGEGIDEVQIQGKTHFIRNLGDGFAALGPAKEPVEKFAGKAGNGKAFETMMGATGAAIAESSDAFLVANMQKVGPSMKEKVDERLEELGNMAMGGAENAGSVEVMKSASDGFFRDASAGIIGLKAAEAGIKLDFGAQFKEGSEFAKYFAAKGNAAALIGSLPNPKDGYYFAAAMDTSSPGLKQVFKRVMEISKKDPEMAKLVSGLNPIEQIEKVDGMSFCMGQSPAMLSGLFLNTSGFIKTSDPKGYINVMKEAMTKFNGKTLQGITYQTSFTPEATKIGELPVHAWTMKMVPDPNSPQAAQIAQVQTMMFGPAGMKGYIAPVESGVVIAYSSITDVMNAALEAAKGGKGLSEDPGIKSVAANLPAGRTSEVFIGVRSLLEAAQAFAPMMGAGGGNFTVPADLPPVGIGGTSDGGGLRQSIYVPTQVITTVQGFVKSFGGGDDQGQDEMESPKKQDKTGQPKF